MMCVYAPYFCHGLIKVHLHMYMKRIQATHNIYWSSSRIGTIYDQFIFKQDNEFPKIPRVEILTGDPNQNSKKAFGAIIILFIPTVAYKCSDSNLTDEQQWDQKIGYLILKAGVLRLHICMRASSSLSHNPPNKPPVVCGACSKDCFAKPRDRYSNCCCHGTNAAFVE